MTIMIMKGRRKGLYTIIELLRVKDHKEMLSLMSSSLTGISDAIGTGKCVPSRKLHESI